MSDSISLEVHVDQFKEQGFTVFRNLFSEQQIRSWKEKFNALQAEKEPGAEHASWWYGDMCERSPSLFVPAVAHPALLEFAERVMGPFVQLDNLTLAGFPPAPVENKGNVSGWHRDRWGKLPQGIYERPNAINAIVYLQDLTPEFGPLRVIPGSHRQAISMQPEECGRPHAEEVVLEVKAGDAVVAHNCILHSGTANVSGGTRYFFSIFYNLTWLRHTDNHNGPNVQSIIKRAQEAGDTRTLRLFGVDHDLAKRNNWGFQTSDEEKWHEWSAAEGAIGATGAAGASGTP